MTEQDKRRRYPLTPSELTPTDLSGDLGEDVTGIHRDLVKRGLLKETDDVLQGILGNVRVATPKEENNGKG